MSAGLSSVMASSSRMTSRSFSSSCGSSNEFNRLSARLSSVATKRWSPIYVGRAVLGHGQLFEDALALLLELLRIEQRVQQAVRQDVERGHEAVVADLGPVHGQLLVGTRVHDAADAFDLLGDLARGGPSTGALEQHVLQEMRDARDVVTLVARA